MIPSSRPLYERWPYPDVPLAASIARPQVWQLNLDWMRSEAGLGPGPARPRIWVAGCGTWQTYPIAVANPGAEVLATDISEASLAITRRRLALHRVRDVTVAPHDLDEAPPGAGFDWIECFGVLMNLRDPAAVMRRFANALSPDGLVRIMVYPWFGRRRVFQIARIAALLGLGYTDERHPAALAAAIRRLPSHHPLRFTFDDYADAATPGGIVDGFLHVSGVAFSAHELQVMADAAGLELAFVVHRPWGDPWRMAAALGIGWDPWAALYALDVWQELKSNFILVLRRKGARGDGAWRLHPAVDPAAPQALGDRARLAWGRVAGLRLQDRRAEDGWLDVDAATYARLRAGEVRHPLGLFGVREARGASGFDFAGEADWRRPRVHLGARVPNPAWDHQLRAYTFAAAAGLDPADPAGWVARWAGHANPLEDEDTPYGFSPIRTWERDPAGMAAWLAAPAPEGSWADVRFAEDGARVAAARAWAGRGMEDAEARELWALVFGYGEGWVRTG